MPIPIGGIRKRFAAHHTLEWLVAGVRPDMTPEVARCREAFVAEITRPRLDAQMDSPVLGQISVFAETFVALTALERFGVRVGPHVSRQLVRQLEGFAAHNAHVGPRGAVAVHAQPVSVQVADGLEGLLALAALENAPAFRGRVEPPVTVQVARYGKCFVAFVALERPLAAVNSHVCLEMVGLGKFFVAHITCKQGLPSEKQFSTDAFCLIDLDGHFVFTACMRDQPLPVTLCRDYMTW